MAGVINGIKGILWHKSAINDTATKVVIQGKSMLIQLNHQLNVTLAAAPVPVVLGRRL